MNAPRLPFTLTPAEKDSQLWDRLTKRWVERIAALHIELENIENTEAKSAVIRGQIKALREQLALNKELPPGRESGR